MDEKTSEKNKAQKKNTSKKKNLEKTQSFQIRMKEQVHQALKERAQQQKVPIGAFIQNLLASLENRLELYKAKYGLGENIKNDKVDTKLIKLLMLKDVNRLQQVELELKIENIKQEFMRGEYKHELTRINDDL